MSGPPRSGTIDSTGVVGLGEAAGGRVSSWLVHLKADGSWSGSVQPQAGAASSGLGLVNVAYKNMGTGENATSALTTTALILVDSAGCEVSLSFTVAAGSMQYHATPLTG